MGTSRGKANGNDYRSLGELRDGLNKSRLLKAGPIAGGVAGLMPEAPHLIVSAAEQGSSIRES